MKNVHRLITLGVVLLGLAAADPGRVTQRLAIEYNTAVQTELKDAPVYLKEYFVPAAWVKVIQDANIKSEWNELIHDSSKPGMVRVLLHPFDKLNAAKIEKALNAEKLPIESGIYEVPFRLTESRSLYPETLNSFRIPVSPRLSMSHGLGIWNGVTVDTDGGGNEKETYNKLISSAQAEFAIFASRLIQERLNGTSGQFFEIMPDRMVISVQSPDRSLDLGETFRDLTSLKRPHEFSVPGFINQDLQGGLLLALANGKTSSYEYLKQIEAPLRGKALAEFFALTGFVHSSPHSQNFLVTTDELFQAKSIKIRDLADLIPTFDSRQSAPEMAALFERFQDTRESLSKKLDGGQEHFAIRHSFIKGSNHMNGFTNEQKIEVEKILADEFVKTLAQISGVSGDAINSIRVQNFSNVVSDYAITLFKRETEVWQKVLSGLAVYRLKSNIKLAPIPAAPQDKLFSEQHEEVENQFKKIIARKLKGEKLSAENYHYLWWFLKPEAINKFNEQEVDYIMSLILAAGELPEGRLGDIFSQLKKEKISLFFELIKQSRESLQLEFLDYVQKYIETSDPKQDYFKRVRIQEGIEAFIFHLSRDSAAISPELFEKLFFVNSLINAEYMSGLAYHKLVDKLGAVPQSVKDYLLAKKQKMGSLPWTFDKLINAPTYQSGNECIGLF